MKYIAIFFGIALLTLSFSTDVLAQQRRFVSGTGSDANPCSRPQPCRSLQAAIDAVLAGGEVVPLDSAGYGTITITKSVTISTPPGVSASITAFSGAAVTVNAGINDSIVLRGLSIQGLGGVDGIIWTGGEALVIDRVSISGFIAGTGVLVTADELLVINDSIIGGNSVGIQLNGATAEGLFASLNRVELIGNTNQGLLIQSVGADFVLATIKDCVVTGNTTGLANTSTSSRLDVENCVVSFNDGDGVSGASTGTGNGNIYLSNSTVTSNVTGIGTGVLSRVNNTVGGNEVSDGTFEDTFSAR